MPFARDSFDLPSPVRSGCTEGMLSKNVKMVSTNAIDAELATRHLEQLDERTAVTIGKLFDADAVIVGTLFIGHFSSAVEAKLVRTATGETEATAYYEGDSSGRDAAKRSCAALVR
ncbi:MAG: hypothetical protein ACXWUG_04390 [Polyangiales bacterium]